ncbi:phosphopantetheine-binding protein [Candidatus Pseudothioglobus singularis]|nr:phosphopantetheine-binding protein [Candidatus Pseudothioglobus singularis]
MKNLDHKVLELLKEALKVSNLNLHDSPETIPQWDSFNQIVILDEVSREFNVKFEDDILMNFYNVEDLINLVKHNLI